MPATKLKKDVPGLKAAEKDSFETTYLQKKFLVSRQTVEEAMRVTGNNRQLVEDYLIKYTKGKTSILL
jgi:hypothetical protein